MRRKLTAACNAFTLGLGMLVTLFLGGPAGALPTAFEVAAAGDIAKDPDDIGIANPTTSDWHAYYLNQQQVATQVHGFVGNGTDAYVFPLGDNQYVSGSGPDYKGNLTAKNDNGNGEHEGPFGGSYHNNTNSNGAGEYAWGDFKSFTRPVAGNGDWKNNADTNDFANILGYKDYFGESLVTNAQGEPWYKITIDLQGGADWQWFSSIRPRA